jgi:RNA polymerase sigma-70 factor, ECF subfamily
VPEKDKSSASDEHLVDAARNGSTEAFEELVARHRDKVYARGFSMLRNEEEALEISQEAWIKSWKRLEQFHGESRFATWITRIVSDLCLDRLRNRKRQSAASIEEMNERAGGVESHKPVVMTNPAARVERGELRENIDRGLERLSDEHRTVLILHEFELLEYKEIAKVMGCSISAVMSRLFYARRKMAVLLTDLEPE